jgi:membrane-bound lytic murein transglycosylase D
MFYYNIAFGYFYQESFNHSQTDILNSFDIDKSFLTDRTLINMQNNLIENRQDWYAQKFDNAHIFLPEVKKILREEGLSPLFIYMAMAESNFSITAYSNKRAAGLWQFMPSTARLYGLKIDRYIDERRDIVRSTKAAAKYLKHLHSLFGKWYLAAIAYNCGEGRLRRAIKKAKSDDLDILLSSSRKYIPRESRIYIRKILSLALVQNKYDFLNSDKFEHIFNKGNNSAFIEVDVPGGIKIEELSKKLNIDNKELLSLNKHLRRKITPFNRQNYHIYIPYNKLIAFNNIKSELEESRYIVHHVKNGETLSHIGKKYRVNYLSLKAFNNLKSTKLKIDQRILIPKNLVALNRDKRTKKVDSNSYIVKSGDTLSEIALKTEVSVKKLKEINSLKNSTIRIGQKLALKSNSTNYLVKNGDTLEGISKKFNMTISKLMKINNLKSNLIKIGDRLVVTN